MDFVPPIFRRTRSDITTSTSKETLPGKVFRRGSLQNGVSRNTTVLSRDINRELGLQESDGKMLSRASSSVLAEETGADKSAARLALDLCDDDPEAAKVCLRHLQNGEKQLLQNPRKLANNGRADAFKNTTRGQQMEHILQCWAGDVYLHTPDPKFWVVTDWRNNLDFAQNPPVRKNRINVCSWMCDKCNFDNVWSHIQCRMCDNVVDGVEYTRPVWCCGGDLSTGNKSEQVPPADMVDAMGFATLGNIESEQAGVHLLMCSTPDDVMRVFLTLSEKGVRALIGKMLQAVGDVNIGRNTARCSSARCPESDNYSAESPLPFGRRPVHRAVAIYKYIADVLKHTPLGGRNGSWIDSEFTININQRDRQILQWVADEQDPSVLDKMLSGAKSGWFSFMETMEDVLN